MTFVNEYTDANPKQQKREITRKINTSIRWGTPFQENFGS
jgi:hypothetical protein